MEGTGGGHQMLNQLMTAVIAGALAVVSLPALALDLPDSGSKNFSPGTGTPTHFVNESVPVSARTADTTASDFSAEEAAAPIPSVARPAASAHSSTARHGKYASAQKSGGHGSGTMKGNSHLPRVAKASGGKAVRTASAYHTSTPAGTTGKRPASVEKSARLAGSKNATPNGTKTATAKHGKAGGRHARSAMTYLNEA
jgi:hypothetical protein